MSNPLANLKKSRKTPLPQTGAGQPSGKNVPFRNPNYSEDESKLLDEITNKMAEEKLKDFRSSSRSNLINPFHGGVAPKDDGLSSQRATPLKTVPTDMELMALMSTRLNHLEQKLQYQTKEMIEKDKKIRILEEKIQILQRAKAGNEESDSYSRNKELERKCLLLQQQVHEMETFLADYGMVWVGDEDDPSLNVYYNDNQLEVLPESSAYWEPEKSTIGSTDFTVDYDQVIRNVDELNALAGDGIAQVEKTAGGAKLKMQDPIPLVLYANGILMFSGPFRPFTDAPTQHCMKDLMDGYFPSELQSKYPDGVPISVRDKRNVYFQDKRSEVFKGSGQVLGGDTKPSRLVPTNLPDLAETGTSKVGKFVPQASQETKSTQMVEDEEGKVSMEVETELPGPKLTIDQFLNKLPQSVIKQGRVIDIRNSVENSLQSSSSSPKNRVVVVETEAVKDMQTRLKIAEEKRPPSAKDLSTLRIKSDEGELTYILKMRFNETIGDIRSYLQQHRSQKSSDYVIMSAFPRLVFEDDSSTLKDCGLIPNATLHLKSTRK